MNVDLEGFESETALLHLLCPVTPLLAAEKVASTTVGVELNPISEIATQQN